MALAGRPIVRAAMVSDRGRVRQENEDACLAVPERGLFVLSDGLGGRRGGAMASRTVVDVLPRLLECALGGELAGRKLQQALSRAATNLNARLREDSLRQPGLRGMGATLVLVVLARRAAHILHLGDSRAYLLRRSRLDQLTEDHTLAVLLFRHREITEAEARVHPGAIQLTRYVGMEGRAAVDVRTLRLQQGDRLLLCSDGLTGLVPDQGIARLLAQPYAGETCHALLQLRTPPADVTTSRPSLSM